MGLKEVAEDLKKQIEEAEKQGEKVESAEDKVEEKKPDEAKEEEETEKKAAEEEKPKKTNADYARERRERLSEAQRLRDELSAANARILELTKPKEEPKKDEDPEPSRDEDPTAWADWRARQAEKKAEAAAEMARKAEEKLTKDENKKQAEALMQQAQSELIGFEDQFKKTAPDYDDVKSYYVNMLAFSIKNLNPKISNEALARAVTNQIMVRASQYMNEGYENPIQAIYDEVKSMGYKPKEEKEEGKKPDLERVAKNRERNAGMAGASGSAGNGELTKRYAATEMTSAEWAKLPVAERERLMRQA